MVFLLSGYLVSYSPEQAAQITVVRDQLVDAGAIRADIEFGTYLLERPCK